MSPKTQSVLLKVMTEDQIIVGPCPVRCATAVLFVTRQNQAEYGRHLTLRIAHLPRLASAVAHTRRGPALERRPWPM